MVVQPRFYAPPVAAPIRLRVSPRLASWNAADHPDQVRLAAALSDAVELLAPTLPGTAVPLTLRYAIGVREDVSLLDMHDLDNYAYPFAREVVARTGAALAAVWCTKSHSEASYVGAEPAVPGGLGRTDIHVEATTTASAESTRYKEEIYEQVVGVDEVPDGPVALHLAFVVGRSRNWLNLWKPTIDALDPILGRTRPDRDWHPRDGRIIELGLHVAHDPALGHNVRVAIGARSAT